MPAYLLPAQSSVILWFFKYGFQMLYMLLSQIFNSKVIHYKTKLYRSPFVIVYWIFMKNKSSELTRLDWVGIRLNQFEMFEESFKLLSRWKQRGFNFETSVVWKPWINSQKSKSLELTI